MIFLSFRHEDSGAAARSLHDALGARFGPNNIYFFFERRVPGRDYLPDIRDAIVASQVVLAIVGKRWLTAVDETGAPRIDDPNDVVRYELALAFKTGKTVIPIRLEDTRLPAKGSLPLDLQPLAGKGAVSLGDERWEYDVATIIQSIERALGIQQGPPATTFNPIYPDARWRGARSRFAVRTRLPLQQGEVILLQDTFAKMTVGKPRWSSVPQTVAHIVITTQNLFMIHLGMTDDEVKSYWEGKRESEMWTLPAQRIRKVNLRSHGDDAPRVDVEYEYAPKKREKVSLLSIAPKEAAPRIVNYLKANAP
jgi:TIR domain